MKKTVYLFSGLGADERVFKFLDFSGFEINYIQWLQPEKEESIENYSKRLTAQITTGRPILIGLSFGGMIATEVAKFVDTEKIILFASAKTKQEIPFYYKIAGRLKLHKLLPFNFLKQPNIFSNWFFGVYSKQDKKLLADILHDTNPIFLKWAIDKVINWKNITAHKQIRHIHGSADRVLPINYVNFDVKVNKGGHLMTVNKSKELSSLIRKELA